MTLTRRITALEEAFREMKQTQIWQTRIGYYMATLLTALTFKILFLGL